MNFFYTINTAHNNGEMSSTITGKKRRRSNSVERSSSPVKRERSSSPVNRAHSSSPITQAHKRLRETPDEKQCNVKFGKCAEHANLVASGGKILPDGPGCQSPIMCSTCDSLFLGCSTKADHYGIVMVHKGEQPNHKHSWEWVIVSVMIDGVLYYLLLNPDDNGEEEGEFSPHTTVLAYPTKEEALAYLSQEDGYVNKLYPICFESIEGYKSQVEHIFELVEDNKLHVVDELLKFKPKSSPKRGRSRS